MRVLKMVILAAVLGVLLIAIGCGGDDAPVAPSATAPIAATVNADGTATTGPSPTTAATAPGTPGYLANVSATLPPSTNITARNADGTVKVLTAAPSFTFTAPADSSAASSGINGVPAPAGFTTLNSTAGAVDVQLTGADSATFNPAITITMPVPGKAVGDVIDVYTVTGTTYTFLGNFTVTTAGLVSFPVSSLSWKVCDPDPTPGTPTTTVPPTTISTTVPATTTTALTTVPTTIPTTVPATTTTVATTVPTTVPTTTVLTTVPATTTTTVAPACGTCHAIPPATGQHTVHVNTAGISCAICHGAGYSPTTVNTATHINGGVEIVSALGWNATTRSCSTPGCHGQRTW